MHTLITGEPSFAREVLELEGDRHLMCWKQLYLWFLVMWLKLQSRSQHERDIARQTLLLQHIISLDNITHSLKKHLRAMILGNLSISLQRQAQYHGGAEAQSLLEQASTFIQEASDIFLQECNDERDQSR